MWRSGRESLILCSFYVSKALGSKNCPGLFCYRMSFNR
ncbi:Uncharacterised protein [Vibrio cholerae]|nr:Uncharacterised protein [Vibrio cholerae]